MTGCNACKAETPESIEAQWTPLTEPCDACNAEPSEPCRFGCLGWAIDHDLITENGE